MTSSRPVVLVGASMVSMVSMAVLLLGACSSSSDGTNPVPPTTIAPDVTTLTTETQSSELEIASSTAAPRPVEEALELTGASEDVAACQARVLKEAGIETIADLNELAAVLAELSEAQSAALLDCVNAPVAS